MFQIVAKSLRIASRTDARNTATKPCLPREADLPRLNVPVGWGGSLSAPPRRPSHRLTPRATLAPPCNP